MPLLYPSSFAVRDTAADAAPTSASAVTVAADAVTANALGTVTEVIASTGAEAYGLLVENYGNLAVSAKGGAGLLNLYVDTGGGDLLVIDSLNYGSHRPPLQAGTFMCSSTLLPLYVPKGSQILAAFRNAQIAGPPAAVLRIYPLNWFDAWQVGNRCITYGQATATSSGVTLAVAGAAWGTWTQITASTTGPARWVLPTWGNNIATQAQTTRYLQIGVGSAGNEKVIGNYWNAATNTSEDFITSPLLPASCDIAAGSRLAARIWNSAGTTAGVGVCLHTFH